MKNRTLYPIEKANGLDNKFRRWLQNPKKIISPYIFSEIRILDFGCGTGFFTIETASMLEGSGSVVAVDIQQGMLDILRDKIKNTELAETIHLHKCSANGIGVKEKFDLIMAFYVIHEVPDQELIFNEFHELLNPNGKILIVEPKFHVSKQTFDKMVNRILSNGFTIIDKPNFFLSRTLLIQKS